MGMPEQLKKQVEEAEQMHAEMLQAASEQHTEQAVEPASTESSASTTTQATEPVSTLQAVPSDQQVPTPVRDEAAVLEHKYRTLQGMFNAQDARYREALAQIEQLRNAISSVQAAHADQKSDSTPTASPGVSDTELQEYTPEFFSMMDRWLNSRVAPLAQQVHSLSSHVAPAVQALGQQVTHVAQVQHQTAEQRFLDALTTRVPNWPALNVSTEFHNWLSQVDPMSGISRQVYLDDARSRLDLDRVANIFDAFERLVAPAVHAQPKSAELAAQAVITPRHGAGSPTSASQDRVYTKSDLTKLYDDHRRGVYKGREGEFKSMEADLLKAISQGRYQR